MRVTHELTSECFRSAKARYARFSNDVHDEPFYMIIDVESLTTNVFGAANIQREKRAGSMLHLWM